MEFKFVHDGCTYYKVKQTKTNLQNYFHPSWNHHYTRFFFIAQAIGEVLESQPTGNNHLKERGSAVHTSCWRLILAFKIQPITIG